MWAVVGAHRRHLVFDDWRDRSGTFCQNSWASNAKPNIYSPCHILLIDAKQAPAVVSPDRAPRNLRWFWFVVGAPSYPPSQVPRPELRVSQVRREGRGEGGDWAAGQPGDACSGPFRERECECSTGFSRLHAATVSKLLFWHTLLRLEIIQIARCACINTGMVFSRTA